ncbi:MAG: DNA mismatch endonuclease Vsr [Spirochaetaceae bacterium]|nr:DNA mismatch endonuclease Vsr [Spirochaetaceae bacterium]
MDTLTPEQRHKTMSHIRSTNTSLEKSLRSQLFRCGFRFRKNDKRYTGTPDIVLPHYNAVIFVNGCFWHAHGCSKFVLPKTNTDFWKNKLEKNRERDEKTYSRLIDEGWRVCIVWECAITGRNKNDRLADAAEKIAWWLEEEPHELRVEI